MITQQEFKALHDILKTALDTNTRLKQYCYYVGGCTRDMILHRPINNIDITVLQPHGGIDFANHITKFYNCYEEGVNPLISEEYGIASFNLGKEFPQLRDVTIYSSMTKKICTDTSNGTKKIAFGGLRSDAEMRDLTINAIYANLQTCQYMDVLGCSFDDINDKRLRTCTDPNILFRDDPLQILRVIRFAAELGWGITKNTWINICRHAAKILKVDTLQIQKEFNNILVSEFADEGIKKLCNSDVMQTIIPDFELLKTIPQSQDHMETVFDHSLSVMMKTLPLVEHRLAGLLHDVGKVIAYNQRFSSKIYFHDHEKKSAETAKDILSLLNYSDEVIESVTKAIEVHGKFKNAAIPSKHAIRRFLKDVGDKHIDICFDVIDANNNSQGIDTSKHSQIDNVMKRIEKIKEKEVKNKIRIPINGKDIMVKYAIKKGPIIGKALNAVKERMSISPKMTKDEAYSIVEEIIEKNN